MEKGNADFGYFWIICDPLIRSYTCGKQWIRNVLLLSDLDEISTVTSVHFHKQLFLKQIEISTRHHSPSGYVYSQRCGKTEKTEESLYHVSHTSLSRLHIMPNQIETRYRHGANAYLTKHTVNHRYYACYNNQEHRFFCKTFTSLWNTKQTERDVTHAIVRMESKSEFYWSIVFLRNNLLLFAVTVNLYFWCNKLYLQISVDERVSSRPFLRHKTNLQGSEKP